MQFCTGSNKLNLTYSGAQFNKGYPGIVMQGGRLNEENVGAEGHRVPDEGTF